MTIKRTVSFGPVYNVNHCYQISSHSLVVKKKNPRAFKIPCTIRSLNFARELCDLGRSINLISRVVYKYLGLVSPKLTTMRLLMADHIVKKPVQIFLVVFVNVASFLFLDDFVILDCEVFIILGRFFLAIGQAFVDIETKKIKVLID